MKFTTYTHTELEPNIQKYWEKNKILEKLRKKNKKGKKWSFLQGPPYTSGKVHLGTAWNTSLKDIALRYKRSQGFNVWDRNGYDVHGLPTAHKVMAKHNLKSKEDIEAYGVDKFIKECKEFCLEMGEQMTKDFKRIGCTLDYSDSYMALKNEYMEGEWWLIKKAWEKKRLYLGEKVMTWCGNCETAVAKHECEYQNVNEDSIFLKFPVKQKSKGKAQKNDKEKNTEFLVIWTTTPWTIPFNLAIMVNPELDYVKAKVDDEIWIVGKSLVGPLVQSVANKSLKLIEEFKGSELEGLEYTHPWEDDIPQIKELKKKHPNVHTVILSEEYVDFSAGSGLVHSAPGCGPEDQEACKPYDIPPFNELDEAGKFKKEIGKKFAGRAAKVDDKQFIKELDEAGSLIATTKVEHDYPHCWRCHKPVIFRTTKQWFFKIEDLKESMVKANEKVHWVPKTQAFDAWTSNLKDNSITRQRYWGTPAPIWKCSEEKCEKIEVIGSIAELKKKTGKVPADLHKPHIDRCTWRCSGTDGGKKCFGTMNRIPDIIDVWIDAGTAGWNCFYHPQREDYLKDYFPADLILEATEQVRLWFSMLSICSQLSMGINSYKNVYMHGMLRDISGVKMSKSLGNIISPDELIEKHGADTLRYYMCQTKAGQDISFSWEEAKVKERQLHILWNVHKLLINLAKENKLNPFKLDLDKLSDSVGFEERYILSKLHSTIKKTTELFESYRFDETIAPLEELFLELSRTYIQMIRDKSAVGSKEEKKVCVYTIGRVLFECLKMFNIIVPFISEGIYLNLKEEFGLKEESISHYAWPKADGKKINHSLEQQMEFAQQIIQAALNSREKARLSLRWPAKEIVVVTQNEQVEKAANKLQQILSIQTNCKEVVIKNHLPELKVKIKPDYSKIGPVYGELSPQVIAQLATNSPETIMKHISREGAYKFELDKKVIKVTKEMLITEHEVPTHYEEAAFKNGYVYLNVERTDELDAEGYSRELMRQLQSLRKKAGLEKTDNIALFVKVGEKMNIMLKSFVKDIEEKVGASKIGISAEDTPVGYKESAEFKVKEETFKVWFEKV